MLFHTYHAYISVVERMADGHSIYSYDERMEKVGAVR